MLICECGILLLYISIESVDIAYMLICECGIYFYTYLLRMWVVLICLSVEKGKMKGNLDS